MRPRPHSWEVGLGLQPPVTRGADGTLSWQRTICSSSCPLPGASQAARLGCMRLFTYHHSRAPLRPAAATGKVGPVLPRGKALGCRWPPWAAIRGPGGRGQVCAAPEQTQQHRRAALRVLHRMCQVLLCFFIDFAALLCKVFPRTLP